MTERNADIDSFAGELTEVAVWRDAATLARWERTTLPEAHGIAAVVRPLSVEQVQRVVRAAGTHGATLYPVSRGKNWGYGDATPSVPGSVVVDLSGMDRVREINTELGYAIVEPGVTQGQLVEAVAERTQDFWVDCTGAGPEASVLGNALERGFGHTPYGDHVRTSCGMECVLADGKVLRTGASHFPGAHAGPVYPYGAGPYIDGIFTQSNLAIVTALTVWLCPRPEAFRFFYIKVERDDALPELLDALRPLRLQGILNSAVHIGNDLRVISGQRRYPHDRAGGTRPLPPAVRDALRSEARLGAWSATGSLTGTGPQVRAAAARLKRALRGIGTVLTLSNGQLALARGLTNILTPLGLARGLGKLLDDLEPHVGLLQGRPTDLPQRGALWGVNRDSDAPADPLEANAGLIWVAPVLPLSGNHAVAVRRIAEPLFEKHGFDFMVTFTLLNERSMVAVMNIAFDRAVQEQNKRALHCYHELLETLLDAGYPPYRVSLAGMKLLWREDDAFWEAATRIKAALDPKGILAPGRYIPPPV